MYSSVYIGILFTTNETYVHVRCIVSWTECKYLEIYSLILLIISRVSNKKMEFSTVECIWIPSLLVSTTDEMLD